MTTPPLMSERDEPSGGAWYDCGWASALMTVYKRGYRAFPLGYGRNEREALERSQTVIAPEHGSTPYAIDVATQKRYGILLGKIPDLPTLANYLKGRATMGLLLGGWFPALPSWQKRWDPSFAGNHSVYVQPMGDGIHIRWMDPLATWGYGGDVINWAVAYNFVAASGGKAANCRFAIEPTSPTTPVSLPAGVTLMTQWSAYLGYRGTWRVVSDHTNERSSPFIQSGNIVRQLSAGTLFSNAQTTDRGTLVNGSPRWLGDATGRLWLHVSVVELVK